MHRSESHPYPGYPIAIVTTGFIGWGGHSIPMSLATAGSVTGVKNQIGGQGTFCLLYTSPSPRDRG
eukprot:475823-Rhodomonas_salina.1